MTKTKKENIKKKIKGKQLDEELAKLKLKDIKSYFIIRDNGYHISSVSPDEQRIFFSILAQHIKAYNISNIQSLIQFYPTSIENKREKEKNKDKVQYVG